MAFKTISIVGLGLMGGSLAATCRTRFPRSKIVGVSRNQKALTFAKKKHWIHKGTSNLKEGVDQADLIIFCTPVDTTFSLLQSCDGWVRRGVLATDVGSVKGQLYTALKEKSLKNLCFVGAHPMVGSHEQGIQAARADLYDSGFTFLISGKENSPAAYKAIKTFWGRVSASVIPVTAKVHDKIVAQISHLPHLAAVCLMQTVSGDVLRFSAKGFRDTTRVAMGHPSVWLPILLANRHFIHHELLRFERSIAAVRQWIKQPNPNQLKKILGLAAEKRKEI